MQISSLPTRVETQTIDTPDATATPPQPHVSSRPSSATRSSHAVFPDTHTPNYQARSEMPRAARQKREADAAAADDPLKDVPADSILDPATEAGLPDLGQLPKPEVDAATFVQRADRYWDDATPGKTSRRTEQQQRLSSNLDQEIRARVAANELSPEGKAVVESFYKKPRDSTHGLYSVRIEDRPSNLTNPLTGLTIMTSKPAGYSYAHGTVTERQENTGTAVLYMPGRDGTLREFPNLKQALDWVGDRLHTDPDFRAAVLGRQSPDDRKDVLNAIHENSAKALAGMTDGTLPETIVNNQIDSWKTSMLNPHQETYSPRLGLDVSRSDESRVLEVDNANTQLIRDRLPAPLKNLEFNAQDKQELKALADENDKQRAIAQSYYGDVPDFAHYADNQIQQQVLKDKGLGIDPSAITVTIPTLNSVPTGQGPGNTWENGRKLQVPLSQFIAQRMSATAPMSWQKANISFSGPGADKLDLPYLDTLADQLELEKNYDKLVRNAFERPSDPDDAAAFDTAKQAAMKASTGSMRFDAEIARRSGDLKPHEYQMVKDVIDHPADSGRPADSDGNVTHAYGLVLNGSNGREGISMRDVTLFAHDGEPKIVVHTPNAPDGKAYRTYADRPAFMADLRQQLASIKNKDPDTWSPMATYWAGQFGSHQIGDTLPWLRQVADGKGGAGLNNVRIDEDLFQHQYDYRTRHLLADADASAMTDNEVNVENGLSYAKAAYRLASMTAPPMITAPLDMAEMTYSLFESYRQYNNGDKEAASHALVDALFSAPGAFVGMHGAFKTFRPSRPLAAAPNGQVRFQRPAPLTPNASGYVSPFSPDSPFFGLYVKDGRLAVKLKNGEYYPAYFDKGTGTVRQGDARPKTDYPFYRDPELRRKPGTTEWDIADDNTLRLRGGGQNQVKQAATDADSDSEYELASESMWQPPITARERAYLNSGKLDNYATSSNKLGVYRRVNTFKYPIRNQWDSPLYVKTIVPEGMGNSKTPYSSDAVLPYIDNNLTPDKAKALYDKVYYRSFTKHDVKKPGEEAMIGQGTVVANEAIRKGEIVGIYAGRVIPVNGLKPDDPFLMKIGFSRQDDEMFKFHELPREPIVISGDNVMSRINSNFDYDANGRPIRQSEDGYNVETAMFRVKLGRDKDPNSGGSTGFINAIFATEDIPAGKELRLNYGYKKEAFDKLFPPKTA
jgi:hypothetical protein